MYYRICHIIMLILIIALQFRLWSSEGGIPQIWSLEQAIDEQKRENEALETRNNELYAQIADLREGDSEIVERARKNLGMIKEGETFFIVVEQKKSN